MAVTIDRADLAAAVQGLADAPQERQDSILAVATALVTEWASTAPDAAHNEAVIRCAAHLWIRNPVLTRERDDTTNGNSQSAGLARCFQAARQPCLRPGTSRDQRPRSRSYEILAIWTHRPP